MIRLKSLGMMMIAFVSLNPVFAQKTDLVRVEQLAAEKKINIRIGGKFFTSFLYPDTLEKPVLYPLLAASGAMLTRSFPLAAKAGDPTDHPHHIGIWFNFENLNGLDFWNNSYAIPVQKKNLYGWIRTKRILEIRNGDIGSFVYQANWTNQQKHVLLEETTRYEFSGKADQRIIDRFTTLKATEDLLFKDAKDGLLGLRLAHELQMPTIGDTVASGNYLTSTGKTGNEAWGTRAAWCRASGKIGTELISIVLIDHPGNRNYPTFWHARGYGLFAANPLGGKIFANGKSEQMLKLQKGESITFRYRIVVVNGSAYLDAAQIDALAGSFAKK